LKINVATVRYLIRHAISKDPSLHATEGGRRTKLKPVHIEFITNPKTLQYWAHLSLKQRAVMFHR